MNFNERQAELDKINGNVMCYFITEDEPEPEVLEVECDTCRRPSNAREIKNNCGACNSCLDKERS